MCAFVFLFLFFVIYIFSSFVCAVILDGMRRLRLLKEGMELNIDLNKPDTWTDLKDSKFHTL